MTTGSCEGLNSCILHATIWTKSSMINQAYEFVQFQVYTTEAGVQICTLSSMVKVVQIRTVGVEHRNLYMGEKCTNLYTQLSVR